MRGNDRRPYIEVTGHEERQESRLVSAAKYSALATIATVGTKWAGNNLTVTMDPSRLSYLHAGLSTAENPWWEVAGLEKDGDKYKVRAKDIFLEGVKRTEEIMGGIPRTFGAFGYLSRGTFTSPDSKLRLSPDDLQGSWSHYQALISNEGGELGALDKVRGFVVKQHEGKSALFRVDKDGNPHATPLVKDVQISARRWAPKGVGDRYHQFVRDTDSISEAMGASPVQKFTTKDGVKETLNNSPFLVHKASGKVRIEGTARAALEAFGDVDKMEGRLNARMTPRIHQALRDGHVLAKRMTERYMRILDQPLEFMQELVYGGPYSEGGFLKKASESKPYGFLKNLFGTGGNYEGNVLDLWARHAGRLGVAAVGLAAGYEVASFATKLVSGRDVAQVAGEVVGATERLYAGASDLTGMTAYNQAQEAAAEGSGSLLGVLAFPFSGYLTGHVAAGLSTRAVSEADELAWRVAREEIHEVPDLLKPLGKVPVIGKYFSGTKTRGGVWGAVGMAIGGALSLPFLPGALGSSESYDEVVAKQSGETEVAVKKGAYWEMGRTDIEGDKTQYFRPGWFRRLQDDGFDDLQYGDYGDRPFSRMVKSLVDPYWREKEYYHERPYAVTGPDTTGMGPLGTLWGMTVGRVLKNPAYMHVDEVSTGGQGGMNSGEIAQFGRIASDAPDSALGGLGPSTVASPYDQDFLAGEGAYKLTEAIGLPGFALSALKKQITGEQDFGTEEPVLASFSEMGSMRDNYWDLNIGGGFGTTEALRRVIPNERFQLQKVNPVANNMPDWMPGPDHFQDFRHGDAYGSIPEGEYRLPGSGYASRFSELKNVAPEDYPDIHKYKILGDVAPYSDQFKTAQEKIQKLSQSGSLSEADELIFRGTEAQLEARSRAVDFSDDKGIIGGYWGALKKLGRMNPVEQLLPISPVHKFSGAMDPISEYESRNVYSTASPSWSDPVEDFIAPAMNNAARLIGIDPIPKPKQEQRSLEGYFDKLEYTKFKMLEAEARGQGEGGAAFAFARKAEYTMYGADPYADIDTVMRALPRSEKPYFKDFVATTAPEDRQRILELVPKHTRKFYTAQWEKQTYAGLAARGDLSGEEQDIVKQIEARRAMEGQDFSRPAWEAYQSQVASGDVRPNTFPDFMRGHELGGYFEDEAPFAAPPTDWLGYDPGVQMDDVKLRVVQSLGKDHHDYNLWEDDVAAARGKPYLDVVANDLLDNTNQERQSLVEALTALKMNNLDIEIVQTGGDKTRVVFDVNQDRTGELKSELEKRGLRYGL